MEDFVTQYLHIVVMVQMHNLEKILLLVVFVTLFAIVVQKVLVLLEAGVKTKLIHFYHLL